MPCTTKTPKALQRNVRQELRKVGPGELVGAGKRKLVQLVTRVKVTQGRARMAPTGQRGAKEQWPQSREILTDTQDKIRQTSTQKQKTL